jgi:hypothetical protein
MKIEVNHYFGYEYDLSVLMDGWCTHADYDMKWETSELVNPDGQDMVQDEILDVCNRCGSYRYHLGDSEYTKWFGIQELPMITVKNSGKEYINDIK